MGRAAFEFALVVAQCPFHECNEVLKATIEDNYGLENALDKA